MGYCRLCQLRVNNCPAGLELLPQGLEIGANLLSYWQLDYSLDPNNFGNKLNIVDIKKVMIVKNASPYQVSFSHFYLMPYNRLKPAILSLLIGQFLLNIEVSNIFTSSKWENVKKQYVHITLIGLPIKPLLKDTIQWITLRGFEK